MALTVLAFLSNPVNWTIAMMLVAGWSRLFRPARKRQIDPSKIARVGPSSPEAVGTALMFLSTAYRPSLEFVAKAQIEEREDAEDDEQGAGDTPRRHFLRQLRRIRRGEEVDRLIWLLE